MPRAQAAVERSKSRKQAAVVSHHAAGGGSR
jgi:hypothetical protein